MLHGAMHQAFHTWKAEVLLQAGARSPTLYRSPSPVKSSPGRSPGKGDGMVDEYVREVREQMARKIFSNLIQGTRKKAFFDWKTYVRERKQAAKTSDRIGRVLARLGVGSDRTALANSFTRWRGGARAAVLQRDLERNAEDAAALRKRVAGAEEYIAEVEAKLKASQQELRDAREDIAFLDKKARQASQQAEAIGQRALRRMLKGHLSVPFRHWGAVAAEETRFGGIRAVVEKVRAKYLKMIMNSTLSRAFKHWVTQVHAGIHGNLLEALQDADRHVRELEGELDTIDKFRARHHRVVASNINRMSHHWRGQMKADAFLRWRTLAETFRKYEGEVLSYRASIAKLERRLNKTQSELGALRLFKDSIIASDKQNLIVRKGGGYTSLEKFVDKLEARIATQMGEKVRDGTASQDIIDRYALKESAKEVVKQVKKVNRRKSMADMRASPDGKQKAARRGSVTAVGRRSSVTVVPGRRGSALVPGARRSSVTGQGSPAAAHLSKFAKGSKRSTLEDIAGGDGVSLDEASKSVSKFAGYQQLY